MNNARFGEIRSMLHSQLPSEQLWNRLTQLLWGWRHMLDQEMLVAYCTPLLETWPDELRTLPKAWLKAAYHGHDDPLLLLCRTFQGANKQIDLKRIEALCACKSLGRLSILDLSKNRFSSHLDRVSWVDLFARAHFTPSLRSLCLHETRINTATLDALEEADLSRLTHLDLTWNSYLAALPHYLRSEHAPQHFEHLVLRHAVEELGFSTREDFGARVHPETLREDGLSDILAHTPVDRLDISGCSVNPDLLRHALSKLKRLHISLRYRIEDWSTLCREGDLSHLEELFIAHADTNQVQPLIEFIDRLDERALPRFHTLHVPGSMWRYKPLKDRLDAASNYQSKMLS